jgi:hypothetical protein
VNDTVRASCVAKAVKGWAIQEVLSDSAAKQNSLRFLMKCFHGRWDIMGRADFAVPYHLEGTHVPFSHSPFSRSRNIPEDVPGADFVELSACLLLLHLSTANSFLNFLLFFMSWFLSCGIMSKCEPLHPCFVSSSVSTFCALSAFWKERLLMI